MTTPTLDDARTEALTRTRKGGFFTDVLTYETARQLALLHWLNPSGGRVSRRSLLEQLMEDPITYTPDDFCNFFVLPGEIKDEIFDVFIFSMEYLARYLRYNERPIVPDAMYPNLYLAYSRDKNHYLALELTADETGLMHTLIGDPSRSASKPLSALSDDYDMQQAIGQVYRALVKRLQSRDLPHRQWGDDDHIGLITPVEPLDAYAERLEQMLLFFLETDVQSEAKSAFVPEKAGDAARRLKQLEMTHDSAYLPRFFQHRVYSGIGNKKKPSWETIPAIERAVHEQRFVDNGCLIIDETAVQVVVTSLDKFDDTQDGAWELFLIVNHATEPDDDTDSTEVIQVVLGRFYTVLRLDAYHEPAGAIPDSPHETLTIPDMVTRWMDGFYLPGFAKTLLQVIEKRDGYVTEDALRELFQNWLIGRHVESGRI